MRSAMLLAALILTPALAQAAPWTRSGTGSLNAARYEHTETLLPNGKVLVVGGFDGTNPLGSAEVYDPATGSWSATGALAFPRYGHVAVLLQDGRVLVAGGFGGGIYRATTEIYDPATGRWTAGRNMTASRYHFAAVRLNDGSVIVSGGHNGSTLRGTERWELSTGVWTNVALMAAARSGHTMTLLADGRLLAVGGSSGGTRLASSEVFDPVTNAWSAGGAMSVPRYRHAATLLPDGRVLVTGGDNGPGSVASVERWTPATRTWSTMASMATPRQLHTATLAQDGTVLVVAGYNAATGRLVTAESFDPAAGAWSAAGSLVQRRSQHTASLLNDGRVLVAGGSVGTPATASAELLSPPAPVTPAPRLSAISPSVVVAGSPGFTMAVWGGGFVSRSVVHWNGVNRPTRFIEENHLEADIPASDLTVPGNATVNIFTSAPGGGTSNNATFTVAPRGSGNWSVTASPHRTIDTLTTLGNGRALATTGDGEVDYPGELYDRAASTWTFTGPAGYQSGRTSAKLQDGRVLTTGGTGFECCFDSADLYDPATGISSPTAPMGTGRLGHSLTLLHSGRVLAAGGTLDTGLPGSGLASAELYDPIGARWLPTGSMAQKRIRHTATLLNDGRVLVAGGEFGLDSGPDDPLASVEIYNPAIGVWTIVSPMSMARIDHQAVLLPNGRVLVMGGTSDHLEFTASAEVFDPATGTWSPAPPMSVRRMGHSATILQDGRVLVAGGNDSSAEIFDPAGNRWVPAGAMSEPRTYHRATLLATGEVLVVGSTAELFDPGTVASPPSCIASSGSWANRSFAAQSETFEAGFDATPGQAGMDGVVGLASGTVSGFSGLAGNVRFSSSGFIDVRFGDHYFAETSMTYSPGVTYHFRMAMNLTTRTYSVFVSSTGAETTLAHTFQFRLEQLAVSTLNTVSAFASTGGETVCNLTISTTVVYPMPSVSSLSPNSAPAGGSDFVLRIFGQNFLSGRSGVRWNGAVREVGYVSATEIQALILASDIANAGTGSVTVVNPGPGGGTSNAATFTITSTATAGSAAFNETFPYSDRLITNAYAFSNPTDPASVKSSTWLVTNGSLFASGGMGWTGVPDNTAPNANSSNGNGSAVFRVITQRADFRDYALSMKLLNVGFTTTSGTPASATDGVQLVLRYQSSATFYLVMVHRRDNLAVIKKKVNGTYTTLATASLTATLGSVVTVGADIRTREDGSVVIQLAVNGTPRVSATDSSSPILLAGRAGLWATNDQFKFDDFTVLVPTSPSGGASVAGGMGIPAPVAPAAAKGHGPNPWRADQHQGLPMTFNGLPPGATVRLFTTSGRSVTSLRETAGSASWDLSAIRSGYYLFVIMSPGGTVEKGMVAVIR